MCKHKKSLANRKCLERNTFPLSIQYIYKYVGVR